MESTDEQLVRRVSDGDRTAFAVLYDRHASRVLGLLVRLLPTRGDADDVLQDVFWQAWKSSSRYDSERGSLRVWLFLIARSRAKDWLRRQKPSVSDENWEATTNNSPSRRIEAAETNTQIQSALSELPDKQRQPIALAYYEGLTHHEISERLGIPLGTAKTRIRLGMQRLRDLLAIVASNEKQYSREVTS